MFIKSEWQSFCSENQHEACIYFAAFLFAFIQLTNQLETWNVRWSPHRKNMEVASIDATIRSFPIRHLHGWWYINQEKLWGPALPPQNDIPSQLTAWKMGSLAPETKHWPGLWTPMMKQCSNKLRWQPPSREGFFANKKQRFFHTHSIESFLLSLILHWLQTLSWG